MELSLEGELQELIEIATRQHAVAASQGLAQAGARLRSRRWSVWLAGSPGSGRTTLLQALQDREGVPGPRLHFPDPDGPLPGYADAAILLVSGLAPLEEPWQDLLESLGRGRCRRVFPVLNRIDQLEGPEQVEFALRTTQRHLAGLEPSLRLHLHPEPLALSARQALEARRQVLPDLLRHSRLVDLERTLEHFLRHQEDRALLEGAVHMSGQAAEELRLQLQLAIQRWQTREAALQARRQQQEPGGTPAQAAPIRYVPAFLAQDPIWKEPIRRCLENLEEVLSRLFDPKNRQQLPRELFQRLQTALYAGLAEYRQELLQILDREWDDRLDHQPSISPGLAARGLEQNRQLSGEWGAQLERRLSLDFRGGFCLERSWLRRAPVRSRQELPVSEIRRELEAEVIRQLGVDLDPLLQSWLEQLGEARDSLLVRPAEASDQALRDWLSEHAALESEQLQLRQDWARLQAFQERLSGLRRRMQALRS